MKIKVDLVRLPLFRHWSKENRTCTKKKNNLRQNEIVMTDITKEIVFD
jgi:hypothetical protein